MVHDRGDAVSEVLAFIGIVLLLQGLPLFISVAQHRLDE